MRRPERRVAFVIAPSAARIALGSARTYPRGPIDSARRVPDVPIRQRRARHSRARLPVARRTVCSSDPRRTQGPRADSGQTKAGQVTRKGAYPCLAATEHRRKDDTMSDNTETAILAAGCFWGAQELLRHRNGVISTKVGYTGGENDNPTYTNHPGHAEAVEIVFDPERISYRDILEFFFQIHDPTTKDRQGNDI